MLSSRSPSITPNNLAQRQPQMPIQLVGHCVKRLSEHRQLAVQLAAHPDRAASPARETPPPSCPLTPPGPSPRPRPGSPRANAVQPRHQLPDDQRPPPPLDAQTPTAAPTSTPHRPDPAVRSACTWANNRPACAVNASADLSRNHPRQRRQPHPVKLAGIRCAANAFGSPRPEPAPRSRARWCR